VQSTIPQSHRLGVATFITLTQTECMGHENDTETVNIQLLVGVTGLKPVQAFVTVSKERPHNLHAGISLFLDGSC